MGGKVRLWRRGKSGRRKGMEVVLVGAIKLFRFDLKILRIWCSAVKCNSTQ